MKDLNLEIISYDKKYKKAFAKLNFEWLEKFFYIEEYDKEVLTKPEKHIINLGGQIFFAKINKEIVGSVALIKRDNEGYELSKMAVTEKYKGYKIGFKLMLACINYARKNDIKRLYLDSNRKLGPALALYKKVGFIEIEQAETPYERTDIRMELLIS